MTHPPVLVLGYAEAGMLLRKPSTVDVRAIIAIHGQREYPVEVDGVSHSLVIQFDDTEVPSATDPIEAYAVRSRQRKAADVGLTLTPPTLDHARSIIAFARCISEMAGVLLCQCQGGISRSPAAALLCLATWTGPGRERYCVERLLSIRPSAVPHRDLVAFGDEVLQREGRLTAAVHRLQR